MADTAPATETATAPATGTATAPATGTATAPAKTKYASFVYGWQVEGFVLAVHVVTHDQPVPSAALRSVAHASNECFGLQSQNLVLIHYLPHHKLIDLTLIDGDGSSGNESAALAPWKAKAETEGIVPFLALLKQTYLSHLQPENTLSASLLEIRYESIKDMTCSTNCTVVDHGLGNLTSWPLLQLFVDKWEELLV